MFKANLTKLIKQNALKIGFDDVGITTPHVFEKEAIVLENIISKNKHGDLKYLEKNIQQRKNIKFFFNNAKSVVIVLSYYYPSAFQTKSNYKISYYTYSNDYHYIIKSKLYELLFFIKEIFPSAEGKIFCDTSAVFEKAYAVKAGLGWIGKNTLLINPRLGSFVFIGGIVTNIELIQDNIIQQSCPDDCNLCINACPVYAIEKPYILNPSRCISYTTIELRGINFFMPNKTNYIAGCDICQLICPFNKNNKSNNNWYKPNEYVFWNKENWHELNSSTFKKNFKNTIFKRIGLKKLKANIENIKANLT